MKSSRYRKRLGFIFMLLAFIPFCRAGELVKEGTYVDFTGEKRDFRVEKIAEVNYRKLNEDHLVPRLVLEAKNGFSLFYPYSCRKITFDKDGKQISDRVFDFVKTDTLFAPNGTFQTIQFEKDAEYPAQLMCIGFYSSEGRLERKVTKSLGKLMEYKYSNDGRYLFCYFLDSGISVFDTLDGSLKKKCSDCEWSEGCYEGINECLGFGVVLGGSFYYEIYDKDWNAIAKFRTEDVPVRISDGESYGWLITKFRAIQWARGKGIVQTIGWPGVRNLVGDDDQIHAGVYNGQLLINDLRSVFIVNEQSIKPLWQKKYKNNPLVQIGNWNDHAAMFFWSNVDVTSNKGEGKLALLGKEGSELLIEPIAERYTQLGSPYQMSCKGNFLVLSLGRFDLVYKITRGSK